MLRGFFCDIIPAMLWFLLSLVLGPAGPAFLYEDPVADRLIRQTTSSSYNLQLGEARTAALSLETRYPDHPAGYTLMAETYWWEAQMDPGNKTIEEEYYRRQELAVEKGEKARKLSKYPKVEVTAYLASAHGSYARFQVTQKQAFLSALRSGLKAHDYAEEVYKLDSSYYDIWVGLGAFNYFTGTLPSYIKPFAYVIGVRGDRDLGLDQLRICVERGRYAQTEGRIVYYSVLTEDKQYAAAFRVLEKLLSDYKDNFVLYTWVTDWYRRQGKNLEGADYFEHVYEAQIQRSPLMAGYALLEKARLQEAQARRTDARQTLVRLRAIPGVGNPLLLSKVQSMEWNLPR
jgi:hypothetical protein